MKIRALLLPLLVLPALLVASAAFGAAAEGRIRALTEPPRQSAWDDKVKLILLANYDLDGSGAIDKNPEVDSIPCSTWKALDDGVKAGWGYGIRIIYGFEADKIWVGDAVGFSEVVRGYSDSKLASCESSGWGGGGGGGGGYTGGDPVQAIMGAAPGQGGGDAWDAAVKPVMLANFDTNGSGWLDTSDEVLKVPCDVYKALDTRVREKWDYGLRVIYGFESDKLWVGSAIGFSEVVRGAADVRIATCMEVSGSTGGSTGGSVGGVVGDPTAAIRSFPGGGTSEWDAKVKGVMLGAYDTNGSGWIDTTAELKAIPCSVWGAMDAGVKQRFSYGLRLIYGFEAGYSWVGDAVGFSERVRTDGDAALVQCGYPG